MKHGPKIVHIYNNIHAGTIILVSMVTKPLQGETILGTGQTDENGAVQVIRFVYM